MNKNRFLKLTSFIMVALVILITAAGCGKKDANAEEGTAKSFSFTVTDAQGAEESFEITTKKATVGDALLEEGLIEGTDGEYGLYVTKVNGIEAIYENDGTYWAFYVNGEYANSGVDSTEVEDGAQYEFKVEGN